MGEYIDRAKAEPLHLKNNVVKEFFLKLLLIVSSQSDFKNAKKFEEIEETTPLIQFCTFLKSNMGCNYLVTKLKQWFNENNSKLDSKFTFRFRGKESFAFLSKFPQLIMLLIDILKIQKSKDRLYQIFLQFLHLRHVISYISRIESFNENLLKSLKKHCDILFKLCVLYDLPSKPSPSLCMQSNSTTCQNHFKRI